jgi:tRNA A37 threonylcarbamoyladenosine dehydratase
VCTSNTNRQLHSLSSTVGLLKVDVLAARIAEINPECDVRSVPGSVTSANADAFVREATPRYDLIVDAIDSVDDKCALIRTCVALDVPIVTTGGAGGKRDPTRVRTTDISIVSNDPLMQQVRRQLREEGWPPEEKRTKPAPWGLVAVSSIEPPRGGLPGEGSCDRFGTATHLTGTFGFAAAAIAAEIIATDEGSRREGRFYAALRERIAPIRPAALEPQPPRPFDTAGGTRPSQLMGHVDTAGSDVAHASTARNGSWREPRSPRCTPIGL